MVDTKDLKSFGTYTSVPVRFRSSAIQVFKYQNIQTFISVVYKLCDLLYGELEILILIKEWSHFIKKNYDLLIFWILLKNRRLTELSIIVKQLHTIFLQLVGIKEWELLFQMLIVKTRKNIIHWLNYEKSYSQCFLFMLMYV